MTAEESARRFWDGVGWLPGKGMTAEVFWLIGKGVGVFCDRDEASRWQKEMTAGMGSAWPDKLIYWGFAPAEMIVRYGKRERGNGEA